MLRLRRLHYWLWLLAAVFLLLRFVHLTADYPRNIRWDDGIATDEGWYASAAVNQQTWGHGMLPGDMNIPVLMPVWSCFAEAAFRVGGFGIVPLRVTAILFFALCAGLLCYVLGKYGAREWAPLYAAMLTVNPWSFCFSRSAFLEFPMLSFVLLAVVLVVRGKREEEAEDAWRLAVQRLFWLVAAGACFALALLLKTTALTFSPMLGYVILQRAGFRLRRWVSEMGAVLCGAGMVYAPYWLLVIRPHQADVSFYLSVVKNTLRLTPFGFVADTSRPFRYGLGSEHLLFPLALLAVAGSVVVPRLRGLWRDPLFCCAGVWLVSFLGFMVKHNNDPARYFAVTIPAVLLVAVVLLRHTGGRVRQVLLIAIAVDMAVNAVQITVSLARPRYSFHEASVAIGAIVRREPGSNLVVIGDEVHEVALQSGGVKTVNLLFHENSITEQMDRYQPGWWLQFAPIEDGRCFRDVLSLAYTAERRGEWTIFYPGQRLVLWKLTPIPGRTLPGVLTAEQAAACKPPVY